MAMACRARAPGFGCGRWSGAGAWVATGVAVGFAFLSGANMMSWAWRLLSVSSKRVMSVLSHRST